ncbi:hypothetical protein ASPCADRAFT_130719 [Aspergillus carbonarius ITEM 5010]|uniref:Uncharacterized protein n=1 Tax=Aspergillus carbonarius (strain ITEM 5010) TaxID=602072 RepID=A0A1R3RL65_ASPC5|nr:hypothetical protein ASPCADRAFT_130719 [Aspergillus carbonarius ITEM 5010]
MTGLLPWDDTRVWTRLLLRREGLVFKNEQDFLDHTIILNIEFSVQSIKAIYPDCDGFEGIDKGYPGNFSLVCAILKAALNSLGVRIEKKIIGCPLDRSKCHLVCTFICDEDEGINVLKYLERLLSLVIVNLDPDIPQNACFPFESGDNGLHLEFFPPEE